MCDCGEEHQREFPAKVQYSVYFDRDQRSPVSWVQSEIRVCVACGHISNAVPEAELQELRLGAGDPG